MITYTMTYEEILFEMLSEMREMTELIDKTIDTKYRKMIRRAQKFPLTLTYEIVTKKNNRYLCITYYEKRGDVFDGKRRRTTYSTNLSTTKDGKLRVLYQVRDQYSNYMIKEYSLHVFKRYAERMHLEDKSMMDVIKEYFKRNFYYIPHEGYRRSKDDDKSCMYSVYDGAEFGDIYEDHIQVNTFIANETMQEGYKSKFNCNHNEGTRRLIENHEFAYGKSNLCRIVKERKDL